MNRSARHLASLSAETQEAFKRQHGDIATRDVAWDVLCEVDARATAAEQKRAPKRVQREKAVEAEGDRLMRALGFTTIRLSQPRHSMQSPGVPDRRYYHVVRDLSVWWEAKSEKGRQTPAQREFQMTVQACGEDYVVGTVTPLVDWLRKQGFILAARSQ